MLVKLRRQFILIIMALVTAALVIMAGVITYINYQQLSTDVFQAVEYATTEMAFADRGPMREDLLDEGRFDNARKGDHRRDSRVPSANMVATSVFLVDSDGTSAQTLQNALELSEDEFQTALQAVYVERGSATAECVTGHLQDGDHPLIVCGLIEHKCVEGMADNEQYMLTQRAKSELLSAYTPSHTKCKRMRNNQSRFMKNHEAIKEKALFFNASDQQHIDRLASLLSQDNFPAIQQRLEEQGMRKGFACLFYGGPGTGKTETVLQIARQTGRDLMQVDIAGMRDKYVGETEKNIKAVFARYRDICRNSEVQPILFFNEADAIFNKRSENIQHSVDKMENAMQNIILQEMEDLDGILIATTNLTSNLDNAFERRFLYKVEFHKPDTDVKTQIWCSMLKDLSTDDARHLASRFDFSGGQIENIARKRAVDYILSGKEATLDEIEDYCRAELLSGKERRSIGFIS